MQDYGGTKTERAFMRVLARGGVVGGSSAGASILGGFMVRGAPSNNNFIMDYPGYQKAFGYLRNVGIDQHVVARDRLPDLADSIITNYPNLLGISEDEGTAWVIRGDTGRIIGRSKAFVYNGAGDATIPDSPFLTLFPATRTTSARAASSVGPAIARRSRSASFASMFAKYSDPAAGGATVLVARDGERARRQRVRHPGAAALHAAHDAAAVRRSARSPGVHRVMRTVAAAGGARAAAQRGYAPPRRRRDEVGAGEDHRLRRCRAACRASRRPSARARRRLPIRSACTPTSTSSIDSPSAWRCQRPGAMRTTRRDGRSTPTVV